MCAILIAALLGGRPLSDRPNGKFRSVGNRDFGEDAIEVFLDCSLSQEQSRGDLFVCFALRYELHYLLLAERQLSVFTGGSLCFGAAALWTDSFLVAGWKLGAASKTAFHERWRHRVVLHYFFL